MSSRAFQIDPRDTVATLLDPAAAGDAVSILGGSDASPQSLTAGDAIDPGHKIALQPTAAGEAVIKFGVRIGHASKAIRPGEWVHLHNLASDHDERSATLDVQSGAPTDTHYA